MKRLLAVVFLIPLISFAQVIEKDQLVQFSGVIVTSDSLIPVPFASVMIHHTYRGTVSDYYGFFSFVAKMNDTIEFAAIGYKKAFFVIPDTLTEQRISMIQVLRPDTIMLKEVVIWFPSIVAFKDAFVNLRVPDDDMTRAGKNLSPAELAAIAAAMPMDGGENFRNTMGEHYTKLYYNNQIPPQSIFDPIKWATFIKQWQSGAFKKKKDK